MLFLFVLGLFAAPAWVWQNRIHLAAFPAIIGAYTAKEYCSCRYVTGNSAGYYRVYIQQYVLISSPFDDETCRWVIARGLGSTQTATWPGPCEGCRLMPEADRLSDQPVAHVGAWGEERHRPEIGGGMPVVLRVPLLFPSPLLSAAEWQLEPDYSRISFVSVKRAKMAEVQRFDRLSGQIDKQGVARIVVPLGTLDSGLALYDERMKDNFLEASRFPEVIAESRLDMAGFDDPWVGQLRVEKPDFTLDLHGQQRRLKVDMLVARQGEGLVQMVTPEPVLLKLLDSDLEEKLKPLKDMVNISSITSEVPVSAVLSFREMSPE